MTDNITLPRSVVEQVLDAFTRGCPPDCKDGMTDSGGVYSWGEPALIRCPACRAFDALRAALEQPQVEQEPVTARHRFRNPQRGTPDWSVWQPCKVEKRPVWEIDSQGFEVEYQALYTHPHPPRQPLTDEQQIAEAMRRHGLVLVKTVNGYDVLKLGQITAHGIGGEA